MARNLVTPVLDRIVDADGIPVTGTLTAYIRGTQTYADIRDVDGTVLANPLTVTDGICTPFITSTDLTIVLKDSDGATLRTTTWLYPTIGITQQGSNIPAYNTYNELVESQATGAVFLLGYNEVGDKPAKMYIGLSERSSSTPDGGYLIRGTNHDYIMASNEIDTRDYGMFGAASAVDAHDSYNATKWVHMTDKTNLFGTRLNISDGYYELPPSLNFKAQGNGVLCPNNTSLEIDIGTSSISFSQYYNGTELTDGRVSVLSAETFSTSSAGIPIGAYKVNHLTVDSNVDVYQEGGITEFTVTHTKSRRLTSTVINSSSKLSTETDSTEILVSCEINEGAFVSGYAFNGDYRNCTIGTFTDASRLLKVATSIGTYVDLKNLEVDTATSITNQRHLVIHNGTINQDVSIPYGVSDTKLILLNCTIGEDAAFTNWSSVIAINCEVDSNFSIPSSFWNLNRTTLTVSRLIATTINGSTLSGMNANVQHYGVKLAGGTISAYPTKYHIRTEDYSGDVPSGYVEPIHFDSSGSTKLLCIGYWTSGSDNYNVYVSIPEGQVKVLYKVAEYTQSATYQGNTVTAHLFFVQDTGKWSSSDLQPTEDNYTESY